MEKTVEKKKNKYRILPIAIGIISIGFVVSVLFAATKDTVDFSPNLNGASGNSMSALTSNESFDGDQRGNDGLEINDNTDKETNLKKGEDELLQNQNDVSGKTGLSINDGTGANGDAPNGSSGITANNGGANGPVVVVPGSGGNKPGGTGEGSGNNGGGNSGVNSGSSFVHSSDSDVSYDNSDIESGTTGSTDYDASLHFKATSFFIQSVTTTTSDEPIYMCPGETPAYSYVKDHITATLNVNSGRRDDIFSGTYINKNDAKNYKGDFLIDWNSQSDSIDNSVPETPGTYNAVVYGYNPLTGATTKASDLFTYYVVDYRVKLMDFDEDFNHLNNDMLIQTVTAGSDRKCNLSDAITVMTKRLVERAASGKAYKHVLKIDSSGRYNGIFLGWAGAKNATTAVSKYKISRDVDSKVKFDDKGVPYYQVDLYPVWSDKALANSLFNITVDSNGEVLLTGYKGLATMVNSIDVPEGVTVLDLKSLSKGGFKNLKLINISSTVNEIIYPDDMEALPALEAFGVDGNNSSFIDVGGVIYNKAGTVLEKVPTAMKSIGIWSKYATEIAANAFNSVSMSKVQLPDSIENVDDYGFANANISELVLKNSNISIGRKALKGKSSGTLSVGSIIVSASTDDSAYLNIVLTYMDYLKNEGYQNFTAMAMNLISTANQSYSDYEYKNGWIICNSGTILAAGTPYVEAASSVPEGVKVIKKDATIKCVALQDLTLPETLASIEENGISGDALSKITFKGSQAPALAAGDTVLGTACPENLRVYVPGGSYEQYRAEWIDGASYIPVAVVREKVMIPYGDNVSTDDNGFIYWQNPADGTYKLVDGHSASGDLVLKAGTTEIEPYACFGNSNISTLSLCEGFKTIGNWSFQGCTGLTSVDVTPGANLTTIGHYAFSGCLGLKTFAWHNGDDTQFLTSIGTYAFSQTGLTGITNTRLSYPINFANDAASCQTCVVFEGFYRSGRNQLMTFSKLREIGIGAFSSCRSLGRMSLPEQLVKSDLYKDLFAIYWSGWFTGSTRVSPQGAAATALAGGGDEGGDII